VPEVTAHDPLLEAALAHHRQPHRAYHDERHVLELLELARAYAPDLSAAERLAILFHDAVYVPGAPRGSNEALSALLMRATIFALAQAGTLTAPAAADIDTADMIIRATTHAAPPPAAAARVCDLDLWRLAAPWDDFCRHAEDIRREFRFLHASDAAFWEARRAFYRSMLEKPAIFATEDFRQRFEPQARTNLQCAIEA
jgi:predicted metal-dependent HD superfamily phosphohydrolase